MRTKLGHLSNRRRGVRIKTDIWVRHGREVGQAFLAIDLSGSGLRLLVHSEEEINWPLSLELELDEEIVELKASKKWKREMDNGTAQIGCSFTTSYLEQLSILAWIRERSEKRAVSPFHKVLI